MYTICSVVVFKSWDYQFAIGNAQVHALTFWDCGASVHVQRIFGDVWVGGWYCHCPYLVCLNQGKSEATHPWIYSFTLDDSWAKKPYEHYVSEKLDNLLQPFDKSYTCASFPHEISLYEE